MKTNFKLLRRRPAAGYALIMVLVMGAVSLVVLAATMRRTSTVALLNDRNNQYVANVNAAEAAVEKVFARLAYDFQRTGLGSVNAGVSSSLYLTNIPNASENSYWSQFVFSDGQGHANRVYVGKKSDYTGPLPSQYEGLFAKNAPLFRLLANVNAAAGPYKKMTNAVQVDVLLALIPLTQYAIFYNSLLEFSTCATMTVNGRTHANSSIYVGSSSALTFNGTVTATGTVGSPANNGSGPWTPFPSGANVTFNGSPTYKTNCPTVSISINMTNTHSLIDFPAAGVTPGSDAGQQLLHNQANVVLLVSNTAVAVKIQAAPSAYQVPGEDTPIILTNRWASTSSWAKVQASIQTNFPFLTITNTFKDQRENKTILTTDIDVGKFNQWITTNASVLTKFPAGSGTYPTILYVANCRTNNSNQLPAVRLTNGVVAPYNGGRGFSVATPNPLYVRGNYNCPNAGHLASTNTSATYPCALMSDALTILSSNWKDPTSFTDSDTGPTPASAITINAAILSGIKPSSGNTTATFSGGVHNLPRLLENWTSSRYVWLNTSIINLFNSTKATGKFVTPGSGSYYTAPSRKFSFDNNFSDYNKVPPGIPSVLVAIRVNWATPPANTIAYDVTP
jgi:hypothetical protein